MYDYTYVCMYVHLCIVLNVYSIECVVRAHVHITLMCGECCSTYVPDTSAHWQLMCWECQEPKAVNCNQSVIEEATQMRPAGLWRNVNTYSCA